MNFSSQLKHRPRSRRPAISARVSRLIGSLEFGGRVVWVGMGFGRVGLGKLGEVAGLGV